jgi:hypothetical protein
MVLDRLHSSTKEFGNFQFDKERGQEKGRHFSGVIVGGKLNSPYLYPEL